VKTWKVLFMLLLNTIFISTLTAQNFESKTNISVFNPVSQFDTRDTLFRLGWHWGWTRTMTEALRMNQSHDNWVNYGQITEGTADMAQNQRQILYLPTISANGPDMDLFQAMSAQYDPALTVDSATFGIVPDSIANDGKRSIFGFRNSLSKLTENTVRDNQVYRQLLLRPSLVPADSANGVLALSGIYPNDVLKFSDVSINSWYNDLACHYLSVDRGYPEFSRDVHYTDNAGNSRRSLVSAMFNGNEWFLSMNLTLTGAVLADTSRVLEIECPYVLANDTTGRILFTSIPAADVCGQYGIYRNYTPGTTPHTIVLRYSDLNNGGQPVTISARFICDGILSTGNPYFPQLDVPANGQQVKSIDIRVRYRGSDTVKINWFRFETPIARYLFRGMMNDNTTQIQPGSITPPALAATIQSSVNQACQAYCQDNGSAGTEANFNFTNNHPTRLYVRDEPRMCHWAAIRYVNNILNRAAAQEMNQVEYSGLYDYYVNPREHWMGKNLYDNCTAVPYYPWAFSNPYINDSGRAIINQPLGLKNGYFGSKGEVVICSGAYPNTQTDPMLNGPSIYETKNWNGIALAAPTKPAYNLVIGSYDESWQGHFENLYVFDRSYSKNYRKLLYDTVRPFWAQYFILNQVIVSRTPTGCRVTPNDSLISFYQQGRPLTAEELRQWQWFNIILGAKGLVYDGPDTDTLTRKFTPTNNTSAIRIGMRQNYYNALSIGGLGLSNPWAFINHDSVGGDFIRSRMDDQFDRFVSKPIFGSWFGVDSNNLYVGRHSIRAQMRKMHDWIAEDNTLLMNLQLQAWYGKGFRVFEHQYNDFAGTADINSLSIIRQYVRTQSSTYDELDEASPLYTRKTGLKLLDIKTYPIVAGNGTNPQCEQNGNIDSAFYDISILKDKRSTSTDVFYMGLLNRRVNNMIIPPAVMSQEDSLDLMHGNNINPRIWNFISESDIDSYVTNTDMTIKNRWDNFWWRRNGARELHIPFNLPDKSKYKFLRITEVGLDMRNNPAYWWRADKYCHNIDTVIGQDKELVVRLLPGEGKLLKIEILKPSEFEGMLDNSNQTKLIAYPAMQLGPKDTSSSMVVYHTCYTKTVSVNNISINRVFYRKSAQTMTLTAKNNIQWEPEIAITQNIQLRVNPKKENKLYQDSALSCDHPSMVVRWDSVAGVPMVYIVSEFFDPLASTHKDSVGYGSILETVFPANITPSDPPIAREIAYFTTTANTYNRFGNPSICAMAEGNVYAWGDSLFGMRAGFKIPSDRNVINNNTVISLDDGRLKPRNPSLNTYSRIMVDEDDCAITWERNWISSFAYSTAAESFRNIMYSRLKYVNGSLVHYVPQTLCDSSQSDHFGINLTDNNLNALLTPTPQTMPLGMDCYPQVYRPVDNYLKLPRETQEYSDMMLDKAQWDRVYWQYKDGTIAFSGIKMRALDIDDDQNCWNCLQPFSFYSTSGNLSEPNVSQGALWNNQVGRRYGDSTYVLTFITSNLYSDLSIGLINHGQWHLYNDGRDEWGNQDTNITIYRYNRTLYSTGSYPHLARLPFIKDDDDWFKNLIIYSGSNGISSSKQYFNKTNADDENYSYVMTGFQNDSATHQFMATPFFIMDGSSVLKSPRLVSWYPKSGISLDTIATNWIRIGDLLDLTYYTHTKYSDNIKLMIERKRDHKLFNVVKAMQNDSIFVLNKLLLVNGSRDEYRFLWINTDKTLRYTESLVFGGLPDVNSVNDNQHIFEKSGIGLTADYLNLGGEELISQDKMEVRVNPNPASSSIAITALIPISAIQSEKGLLSSKKITLRLYSSIGNEVASFRVNPGEAVNYNVEHLSNGSYFVRAELEGFSELLPAFGSFVISR